MSDQQEITRKQHIKIGVIGTETIVKKVMKVIPSFPSLTPIIRIYSKVEEAPVYAKELENEAEVLLVSGPAAQRRIKEKLHSHIPILFMSVNDTALIMGLVRAFQEGVPLKGLSIDTLTESMVRTALNEAGMQHIPFECFDGPAYATKEKLIDFHKQQFSSGQCTMVFTSEEAIVQELDKLGIPNQWLIPAERDIIVSLERALLATETRRNKEAQIVVGLLHVDQYNNLILKSNSEHEMQKIKLDIHRKVLDYVESLDGYLSHLGGEEYLFFTTRGVLERETGGYKTIPLAKDVHHTFGASLSIGIGFGDSANEAGTNARKALRKAKETGGNSCFIVREDAALIGPLEMADAMQTVLSVKDHKLLKQAEEAGMTSEYISKLLTNAARFDKVEYHVHELSFLLGVTSRTIHRLLQQWIDHGLVESAGMEKMPKGRPRQIFRFVFLKE